MVRKMKEKKRAGIHNRLFFKMFLSYACVLTIAATLIGVIYMKLYSSSTKKNYLDELEQDANTIAYKLGQYIIDDDYEKALDYLVIQMERKNRDLWLISNESAREPMSARIVTMVDYKEQLGIDSIKMIERVFEGETIEKTYETKIHQQLMNVVGVPIKGKNRENVGALIYSASAQAQAEVIQLSIRIIIQCIVAALLVSFMLAYVFVRNITTPILKMRNTAGRLAEGEYACRTDVVRSDEIGQLACTVDILADRLLENEQERKNMEQMRLDFFANVSHELRTPITVIRAYTETLYDKVVTEEDKVHQYYERMLSECQSMERLVGDLLVLSKMQNPDFMIEKEPVNIIQVFEDIIRSASAISEEKGVHILEERNTDCCLVLADYDRLRQMFMIILDNAIKFSNPGSTIDIKVEQKEFVIVSIRDHGVGISKEELPYIFDKFYKSKLRQNAKGSGLGLAIARQIAYKHEGEIEVYSEPGQGTEFRFIFSYLTEQQLEEMDNNSV